LVVWAVCLSKQPKKIASAEQQLLEDIIYERVKKKTEAESISYERATLASTVE
jgi:hypothetical protein